MHTDSQKKLKESISDVFSELDKVLELAGKYKSQDNLPPLDKTVCQITEHIGDWCASLIQLNLAANEVLSKPDEKMEHLQTATNTMVNTALEMKKMGMGHTRTLDLSLTIAIEHVERAAKRCQEVCTAISVDKQDEIKFLVVEMVEAINGMSRLARNEFLTSPIGQKYIEMTEGHGQKNPSFLKRVK